MPPRRRVSSRWQQKYTRNFAVYDTANYCASNALSDRSADPETSEHDLAEAGADYFVSTPRI